LSLPATLGKLLIRFAYSLVSSKARSVILAKARIQCESGHTLKMTHEDIRHPQNVLHQDFVVM